MAEQALERDTGEQGGLQKSLKMRHMTMISLGGVIGAGLFIASGPVINGVGPAAILTYALTGILLVLIMRMLGEMAVARPSVGSFSDYSRMALGDWAGFSIGWLYWYFWVIVVGIEAEPGVWVDESASGLTHEPGVWVDPPAIDPDRLGPMIREQSGVTEHLGDVQEPNVGGVPQPGSAEQIHSLDLSSAYEEVSRGDSVIDSVDDQIQWGTQTKSENANEEALEGANKTDNFEIQRLLDNSNEEETNAASVKEKAQDVIANSSEKSKNANEQAVKDGLDLSSAYEEVSREDSVFDSVYGQIQETKSSKANEEALQNADEQALLIQQQKSLSAEQRSLEEMTNKDGLDLSSVYQEATPINPVFDSVYGQTQGAEGKEVSDDRDAVNPLLGPFQGPLVGTKIGEEIGAELQDDTFDALDLSSAYEEVSPKNPSFDSLYGQTQGATPPKVEPSQYPPDLPSPSVSA